MASAWAAFGSALSLLAPLISRVKDLGVYLTLNVLQRGVALIMLPFYTSALVPMEYGIIALAAAFSVVSTVSYACIPDAIYFAVLRKAPDEVGRTAAGLRLMGLVFAVAMALLALVSLGGAEGTFVGAPIYPHLFIVIASVLVQAFFDLHLQVLQAKQQPNAFARLAIIKIVLNFAVVLSVLQVAPSALALLIAQLGVNLMLFVAVAPWIVRSALKPALGHFRSCLGFGLPLVPHSIAHWGRSGLDRLLLGQFSGAAALGTFSVAFALGSLISLVVEAYLSHHNPLQFEWLESSSRETTPLRAYCMVSVAVFGLIGLGILGLAPLVYMFFVGRIEYHSGIVLLPALVGASVAFSIYINTVNWIFREESSEVVARYTLSCSLATLPVSVLLIAYYGFHGAAISGFLSAMLMALAVYTRCRRYTGFAVPLGVFLIPLSFPVLGLLVLSWSSLFWPGLIVMALLFSEIIRREMPYLRGAQTR